MFLKCNLLSQYYSCVCWINSVHGFQIIRNTHKWNSFGYWWSWVAVNILIRINKTGRIHRVFLLLFFRCCDWFVCVYNAVQSRHSHTIHKINLNNNEHACSYLIWKCAIMNRNQMGIFPSILICTHQIEILANFLVHQHLNQHTNWPSIQNQLWLK